MILQSTFLNWTLCFAQPWPGFSFPRICFAIPRQVGQLLESRPTKGDLVDAGVHRGDKVAASIQGVQATLQRKMARDNVGHLLESRPAGSELHSAGILKHKPHGRSAVAPRLQGLRAQLEKQMAKDQVGHLLETRPARRTFVELSRALNLLACHS